MTERFKKPHPDPPKIKRPEAVYQNIPSQYGIADELHKRKLTRTGRENNIFTQYRFK